MDTYLLIKYLKCATTREEEALVQEWLANDPDGSHEKQYKDAHDIFNGMTIYSEPSAVDAGQKRKDNIRRISFAAMRIAAAVVLMIGVGLWVRNDTLDAVAGKMERIQVPAGKSLCMTLEDGTRMWLNAGSDVEYPAVFSRKDRTVKVNSGEVLFDVTRNEDKPFFVDSYAARISVLGTKFNVKVDKANGRYSAELLRGSIKVSSNSDRNETYILKPNNMVELVGRHLKVSDIEDADLVSCWTEGIINVSGVPFAELMRTFELAFGVDIDIERETMPEISFTRGKVRVSDGLDHALSVLKLGADFEYERDYDDNRIIIR